MASIGITSVPSGLFPSGGVAEEVSVETSVEVKTLKDKAGVTKHAQPMGFSKKTTVVRGYGDGSTLLASVTTGAYNSGKKITEVKATESNEDFPKFEATEIQYT
jgi:hypothetical protein